MTEDELEEGFKIFTKPRGNEHDVYLSDSVESDSFSYIDLLRFLDNAPPCDIVNIHLANFGGACHTGFRIAHAMKGCAAYVNVVVDAPCYSMGAILAICGNSLTMRPGTFLMFHNYSASGVNGKGTELLHSVAEYHDHFHYTLYHLCYPFLTKKELDKLERDFDVYVKADDLESRCKRHFKD